MKRYLLLFLLAAGVVSAQTPLFPGLKSIMTAEEYERSGLAQLTPEQLSFIDAAIMRHITEQTSVGAMANPRNADNIGLDQKSHYGLPDLGDDWRGAPSLKAKCTGWVGGNSFKLDNGQVWEGTEPIPYELVNRNIEIQPRPGGAYALIVEGKNTTIRIRRLK
ncbi:hypothetical protein K0B96_15580 [Horticoccus luteus]|uniref:Uncharacterized protein n=1 Tax=Horticoccus luteus TaxID=2862869 RepID=A0A8F9TV96_9BACT|nr:hypothetical protein [Horticoccus luteus]QYM78702.1 hypothetical protein K0B96_15580 [Horticoccus luteus]